MPELRQDDANFQHQAPDYTTSVLIFEAKYTIMLQSWLDIEPHSLKSHGLDVIFSTLSFRNDGIDVIFDIRSIEDHAKVSH